MGMVHERPLIVKRRTIDASDVARSGSSADEAASVLEIRDDDRPSGDLTPRPGSLPGGAV
jgi:hypothetical protein